MGIKIVLLLAILLNGLLNPGFSALIGFAFLLIYFFETKGQNKFKVPKSLFLIALLGLTELSLLVSIWSLDYGMALLGGAKYFPLLVFIFLISQMKEKEKEDIISSIPLIAAISTIVGLIGALTPFKDHFVTDSQFNGTFTYANSFALFLLIAFVVLLFGKKSGLNLKNEKAENVLVIVFSLIITSGLVLTGSRLGLYLYIAVLIAYVIISRKNKEALSFNILAPALASPVVLLIIAFIIGKAELVTRYFTLSIHNSSLMNRVVYLRDGFSILKDHLFGLGYKGYSFIQGSYRTGNYDTDFVYNDFLQIALDLGVIIGLAVLVTFIIALVKKDISIRNRSVLILSFIFFLTDYAFQFTAILLILSLFIDTDYVEVKSKDYKAFISDILVILCVFSLWTGIAQTMEVFGKYDSAVDLYPMLTTSQVEKLKTMTEADEERTALAEKIRNRNEYALEACMVLAEDACLVYDFDLMTDYGFEAIKKARFEKETYQHFLYLLNYGIKGQLETDGDNDYVNQLLYYTKQVNEEMVYTEGLQSPEAKYMSQEPVLMLDEDFNIFLNEALLIA